MKRFRFVLLILLVASIARAGDIRDLLDADTKEKQAVFTYNSKMNFFVVSGPRDGYVVLRAFPGTLKDVLRRAHSFGPDCAHMDHFVFGGWWTSASRLTFNYRFDDWSVQYADGSGTGKWVFIFDVQPLTSRRFQAGFIGLQELQLAQSNIDNYFSAGIEVTVINRATQVAHASRPAGGNVNAVTIHGHHMSR